MATNPTLITTPFAQSGDKTTPPNTNTPSDGRFSQTLGFPPVTAIPLGSGGKAPKREDFNGALNMLASLLFYTQKGWIFQFDAAQDYYEGCLVRDMTDGTLYECIGDVSAGGSVPSADSVHWKTFSVGGGVSAGFILPYGGTALPDGFLACDGSAISRTTYADLFSAIGTTWGAGNGSTTFNIPTLTDSRFLEGSTSAGTIYSAGLPNITGGKNTNLQVISNYNDSTSYSDGALSLTYFSNNHSYPSGNSAARNLAFDASLSNSIYGASSTVQPKAATVKFCIKY